MFPPAIQHHNSQRQSSSLSNQPVTSASNLSLFSKSLGNQINQAGKLNRPVMMRLVLQLVQQILVQIQNQQQATEQPASPPASQTEIQIKQAAGSPGDRGAADAQGGRGAADAQGGRGAADAKGGRGAADAQGGRGAADAQGGRGRGAGSPGGRGAADAQGGRGAGSPGGRGATDAQGGRGVQGDRGAAGAQGTAGSQGAGGTQATPEFRSIDGTGNNLRNTELGSTSETFRRVLTSDPTRAPGGVDGADLPNVRDISNAVSNQIESTQNSKGASDMFWLWGQFLDHDITLSAESHETANIEVPTGDRQFDPFGSGTQEMRFTRSESVKGADGQNNQINEITAFIDGSNVYGSDQETADSLRSFDGGKMILTDSMMPQDERGHFMAGDVRANENPGLTSMHTLWAREHNRIAEELAVSNPDWGDERLYQEARNLNSAQMQAVTYNEFLPMLLGDGAIGEYQGYDSGTNPEMSNAFVTAAYRFGHSMVSPNLLRLDEDGQEIPEGNLGLRDAFFQPERVMESGISPILRGASSQTAQEVDTMVVDDLRNVLFGAPGAGGMDLVALNIQRGRDHELPGYNDAREQLGLSRIDSFDDPIWKEGVGARLAEVYDSPDDVDLWVAGLAEKPVGDAMMGETNTKILTDQFTALRDGDRFWYENQFSGEQLDAINNTSLSDIIKRNSDVQNIQDEVMVASNNHLK